MKPISSFFEIVKRPSTTQDNRAIKKAHIETVAVEKEN